MRLTSVGASTMVPSLYCPVPPKQLQRDTVVSAGSLPLPRRSKVMLNEGDDAVTAWGFHLTRCYSAEDAQAVDLKSKARAIELEGHFREDLSLVDQ